MIIDFQVFLQKITKITKIRVLPYHIEPINNHHYSDVISKTLMKTQFVSSFKDLEYCTRQFCTLSLNICIHSHRGKICVSRLLQKGIFHWKPLCEGQCAHSIWWLIYWVGLLKRENIELSKRNLTFMDFASLSRSLSAKLNNYFQELFPECYWIDSRNIPCMMPMKCYVAFAKKCSAVINPTP